MKTIILSVLSLTLLTSCGNSLEFKEDPVPSFGNTQRGIQNTIDFNQVQTEIFSKSCNQCHPGYSDYKAVFDDRNKILKAVQRGTMPKNAPALDNDLQEMLSQWVLAGAPNTLDLNPPPPTQEEKLMATWSSLSKRVFFPKCVQCHNPQGQASFLDLSTRQKFFDQRDYILNNFEDVETSFLIEVLRDPNEPMPPAYSGLERLDEEEIKAVIKWIELGLPN